MCGIVGYIGKKKALPILLHSLKTLEYRGYDSAGVAYILDNNVNIVKSVGRINDLENKIDKNISSYIGIGHTRWATHGGINLENCHPHKQGRITLVHNGIIENYIDLKKKLIDFGYTFYGDSDSEVLCALMDYYYKMNNDILVSLDMVIKDVKGSYACVIIVDDDYDKIYTIRKDSPLVIGIGNNDNFIASDVLAILKYTNKYILLDDGDIGIISLDKIEVYNDGIKTNKDVLEFEYKKEIESKYGFSHYMLKEIYEQGRLVRENIPGNLDDIPDISKYNNIYIVGCGSAYNAGMVGKYLFEEYTDKFVYTEIASEFRYKNLKLSQDDLVIFISQSGETADTLASLRKVKKMEITTLAIVNVVGSSISREADMVIYTMAGSEIAVATTKAYLMQVFMLGLIVVKNSNLNYMDIIDNYDLLVKQIDMVINNDMYKEVAKKIYMDKDIFFLGRGIDYCMSIEGNLKLKEIAYIHSEAYPAGELKHGTIALIDRNTPVISIITDKNIKDKTLSNIREVISRGARSIIIYTDDIDIDKSYYDMIVKVPSNIDILKPILTIIPLQLISYEVAKLRGCDIDKPKNLAKSVTVE